MTKTNLYSPNGVRELLAQNDVAPLKSLGQNFLIDRNLAEKIVQAAVPQGGNVLEVGPGLGGITHLLGERANRVVAVEIDRGMVALLGKTIGMRENVDIIHSDFLETNLAEICREHFAGEPFYVVGNLPYYITSKCLLHVLEAEGVQVEGFTAMVQKEVAERLLSPPGNKIYGALSASVAFYGQVELLFSVPASCFYPTPDVDSAIIQIVPGVQYDVPRKEYVRVVRALFAMRRKTVLNNLRAGYALSSQEAREVLAKANIEPSVRAETLTPKAFARLAAELQGV